MASRERSSGNNLQQVCTIPGVFRPTAVRRKPKKICKQIAMKSVTTAQRCRRKYRWTSFNPRAGNGTPPRASVSLCIVPYWSVVSVTGTSYL